MIALPERANNVTVQWGGISGSLTLAGERGTGKDAYAT